MTSHRAATSATPTARAFGKVNVMLRVGERRPDGYHDLTTVFQAVDLPEIVTVSWEALPGKPRVAVSGPDAALVPTGADNLAVAAVRAVAGLVHPTTAADDHFHMRIRKEVPVAGGMAGGSADAAAALVVAAHRYGIGRDDPRLVRIAAALGADVPFCLAGGTAIGRGVGEHLTAVTCARQLWWVIVTSARGLSTPAVFAELDRQRAADRAVCTAQDAERESDALARALESGCDPSRIADLLVNDLQAAALALRPELGDVLAAVESCGALRAVVSGSGPTVIGLAQGEDHARAIARALRDSRVGGRVLVTRGPVGGAGLVATGQV